MINYTPGRITPLSLRRRCVLQNIITKEAPGGGWAEGGGQVVCSWQNWSWLRDPAKGWASSVGSKVSQHLISERNQ